MRKVILLLASTAFAVFLVILAVGERPVSAQAVPDPRLQGTITWAYTYTEGTYRTDSMTGSMDVSLKPGVKEVYRPADNTYETRSTWVDDGTSRITAQVDNHGVLTNLSGQGGTCTIDTVVSVPNVLWTELRDDLGQNVDNSYYDFYPGSPYYPYSSGATKALLEINPSWVSAASPYSSIKYVESGDFPDCFMPPDPENFGTDVLPPPGEHPGGYGTFVGELSDPNAAAPTIDFSRDDDYVSGAVHVHLTVSGVLSQSSEKLEVTADREESCENQRVTFTAAGADSVRWSGGGNPANGEGKSFTTQFTVPGAHEVQAEATDGRRASKQVTVWEPSGLPWVNRYPGSSATVDLAPPFRENVDRFIGALRAAGANVRITATYRPAERAHLMYYAHRIANQQIAPENVPRVDPPNGINPVQEQVVPICWVHYGNAGAPDLAASRAAAQQMIGRQGYNIVFAPAHPSRHEIGNAIDMNIAWNGTLRIRDANNNLVRIGTQPRTGAGNQQLWAVGATYFVQKLPADAPHWSDNGR